MYICPTDEHGYHDLLGPLELLARVEVDPDPEMMLTELVDRACQSQTDARGLWRLAFLESEDTDAQPVAMFEPYELTAVRADGKLRWFRDWNLDGVTVSDLERAKSEGLFHARTDAFLAYPKMPIGNGLYSLQWQDAVAIIVNAVKVFGAIGGLYTFGQLVSAGLPWLNEHLSRSKTDLETQGAESPADYIAFVLSRERWNTADLAGYFTNLDAESAKTLLRSLGYDFDRSTQLYAWSGSGTPRDLGDQIARKLTDKQARITYGSDAEGQT